MTTAPEQQYVLIVTADDEISRPAQRVVAAAGLTPVTCAAVAALSRWRDAAAVLVGVDALDALLKEDPVRRDAVYVVAAEHIPDAAWRECVALGAIDALSFAESEGWLVDRLTLGFGETNAGLTIRVIGSTGGCGASVTVAGLALASGDEGAVVLDTDLRSGWIDLLLGLEPDGLGWGELSNLRGRVSGDALTASIPTRDGISLISVNRDRPQDALPADAVRSAVLAASGLGSLVVVDDHAASGLRATTAQLSDITVLVTTSDLRGGLAARRALETARGEPVADRARDTRPSHPVIVAARTPRGAALPTATFAELTDLADDTFWLREVPSISRRVSKGQVGLLSRERFVRDCGALLERCHDLAARR